LPPSGVVELAGAELAGAAGWPGEADVLGDGALLWPGEAGADWFGEADVLG